MMMYYGYLKEELLCINLVDSMIVTPSPTPMLLLRGKPAIMTTLCHVAGGDSLLRRPLPTKQQTLY